MKKLMLAAAFAAMTTGAFATNCYWQGPDGGDWWDTKNWLNGVRPDSSGDTARFNASYATSGTVVITNAEALKVGAIDAQTGTWTLLVSGTWTIPGTQDSASIVAENQSSLTIEGGVVTGACYRATESGQIKFHNCVNLRALTHRRNSRTVETPVTCAIDSGIHEYRTIFTRLCDSFLISGGSVTAGSIYGSDKYGESKQSTLPTPFEVTGGRLLVDGGDSKIESNVGVGIYAHGNAVVRIVPGGSSCWIADRQVKSWRVDENAWFKVPGPYMALGYNSTTAKIEVVGGRFQLTSNLGGQSSSSEPKSGRRAEVLLDGGILDCDFADNGSLPGTSAKDDATGQFSLVGPKGGTIRNRNNVNLTVGSFTPQAGAADGSVTYDGLGTIIRNTACTLTGEAKVRCNVRVGATSGALGSGATHLMDGGTLVSQTAGINASAIKVTGQGYVCLDSASATVTAPSLDVADKSALVLTADVNYDKFGTNARYLSFTTPPARRTDGLFAQPVFLSVPGYSNSAREMHLATWDAENNRVTGVAYTNGWGDANSVSYVTSGGYMNPHHVGALVLRAPLNGGSSKNTLTIGNGEGNAYLCLNAYSNGSWAQIDNARISFGTAHGVIGFGNKVSGVDTGTPYINGTILGSAGVSFVGTDSAGLRIQCAQDYTGGTQVLGGELIMATSSSTFGSGAVEVSGGESHGGCVRFWGAATLANDWVLSGFGTGGTTKKGALSFEAAATLSGQVSLTNDAMVCATSGKTGTFAKPIKGTGDLYLGGAGTLALAGIDLAGDVHVTGNVTTTGGIDTDGRFLFVDGTLTFSNAEDITVNAKVLGAGKIVLAGTGKVDFTDISIFDGVIDLAGQDAAIGALYGEATITNSSDTAVTLSVGGTSEAAFFGTIYPNVNLAVGGKLLLGPTADVLAAIGLTLNGGTLGLYEDRTVASLAGNGAVKGRKLTVTGATVPAAAAGSRTSMTFDLVPALNTLPPEWKLKVVGAGAQILKKAGLVIFFH